MNNVEAAERFDQLNSPHIEKLLWFAGCLDDAGRRNIIDEFECIDMDVEKLKKIFDIDVPAPNLDEFEDEYFQPEDVIEFLIDREKFGLYAEVHFPECSDFEYKDNVPCYWTCNFGISRIEYFYTETLEELMEKIEIQNIIFFQEFIKKDKLESQNPTFVTRVQ